MHPRLISNADARAMHAAQYVGLGGRHEGSTGPIHWPFWDSNEPVFVQACVPTHLLDAYPLNLERAGRYADLLAAGVDLGPAWGRFTARSAERGLVYLADGNHRAYAATVLGLLCYEVVMPESHYIRLEAWVGR